MMAGEDSKQVTVDEKIRSRARHVFDQVDKNHDGQVTVDELVNVCMRNPDIYNMIISSTKSPPTKKS